MVGGLVLSVVLFALGIGTALRQKRTLNALAARTLVPSDERDYFRGQARRRFGVAGVLIVIGIMIASSFISGIEEHAEADHANRDFARFYGAYWIVILLLVFVVMCLAVFDFWATRRYWMRVYRRLREDHNTLLQRDIALYRQQKMAAREARIRRGLDGGEPAQS